MWKWYPHVFTTKDESSFLASIPRLPFLVRNLREEERLYVRESGIGSGAVPCVLAQAPRGAWNGGIPRAVYTKYKKHKCQRTNTNVAFIQPPRPDVCLGQSRCFYLSRGKRAKNNIGKRETLLNCTEQEIIPIYTRTWHACVCACIGMCNEYGEP